MESRLRTHLSSHVGQGMAALLLAQPLLDVLSYFMQEAGSTAFTTALRMAMLAAVALYGFLLAEKKRPYYILGGVLLGFWLLHMANCFRLGYQDPVGDAAEFLKLAQFPLWTLAFSTFLRQREGLDTLSAACLAGDFVLILGVIALSYAVGMPEYTYDYADRGVQLGVMGWFGVHSAQSAIVTLLVPGMLLWAYRKGKLWLFTLCSLFGFGLLYFTGTRVAYVGAILIAGGFLALVLLGRKRYVLCLPLAAALAALVVFQGASPMAQRRSMASDTESYYIEKSQEIMGEDAGFVYEEGEEVPPQVLEKLRTLYTQVFGKEGLYHATLLGDLIDKFGVDAVMEAYDYTVDGQTLYDMRTKKIKAMELTWQGKDFPTRLLGFEHGESYIGENNYDPETDFHALLYFYGYGGAALYLAFCAWFPLLALWQLIKHRRRFWQYPWVPAGTFLLQLALGFGAALLSGSVLRRPSVTVYLALAAALLAHCLARWDREQNAGCAGEKNMV